LIEIPPVSKVTPLPTKATGASPCLPPFQRSDEQPRLADRALGDTKQSAHAELAHRRPSSTSISIPLPSSSRQRSTKLSG
jgi:hypothetical protein